MRHGTRVLAWGFWPAIVGTAAAAAALHVEPNWAAVSFPSLFAGWALAIDALCVRRPRTGLALAGASLALNLALAVVVHAHAAGLVASSLVGRGPAARLHGWSQLARVIASSSPGRLETDDYGLAASLSYYGRGRIDVELVQGRPPGPVRYVWRARDARLGIERTVEGVDAAGRVWIAAGPASAGR
jgi:hypothetical protein